MEVSCLRRSRENTYSLLLSFSEVMSESIARLVENKG